MCDTQVSAYFESGGAKTPAASPAAEVDEAACLAAKERGNGLLKKGELDGACAAYREALAHGTADPAPLHSNLSLGLLKLGKVEAY